MGACSSLKWSCVTKLDGKSATFLFEGEAPLGDVCVCVLCGGGGRGTMEFVNFSTFLFLSIKFVRYLIMT